MNDQRDGSQEANTAGLNPAQLDVLAQIGSTDRPTFRPELRHELRSELEAALFEHVDAITATPLFISKRKLTMVHQCEARLLAEETTPFEWSVPVARGTVAHKAIELLVGYQGEPTPLELVDEAIDRLTHDLSRPIAEFLVGLSAGERAELTSVVNDYVASFVETFPPLKRRWKPVPESRVRTNLCDDQVLLSGIIDLSLGFARGTEAGKVIIDFKTGRPHRSHVDDLRFYALLETMKVGVPPRLLANYYLEAGEVRTELVTEDLLWSTAKRVVDAALKLIELGANVREPRRQPSTACAFCPLRATCDIGTQFLANDGEWGDP